MRGLPEAPQLPYLSAPPTAITHRHTGFCFPEPRDKVCLLKVVFRVSSVIPSLDYLVTLQAMRQQMASFHNYLWVLSMGNLLRQLWKTNFLSQMWKLRGQGPVRGSQARSTIKIACAKNRMVSK